MIEALLGFESPTAEIAAVGSCIARPLRDCEPHRILRRGLGFVAQQVTD